MAGRMRTVMTVALGALSLAGLVAVAAPTATGAPDGNPSPRLAPLAPPGDRHWPLDEAQQRVYGDAYGVAEASADLFGPPGFSQGKVLVRRVQEVPGEDVLTQATKIRDLTHAYPGQVRVVGARASLSELKGLMDRVAGQDLVSRAEIFSMAVDGQHQAVVVETDSIDPAVRSELRTRFGPFVSVRIGSRVCLGGCAPASQAP